MAMMEQATGGIHGREVRYDRISTLDIAPFWEHWIGRLPRVWRSITDKKVGY